MRLAKELNKASYDYINNAGENEALEEKAETLSLSGFVLSPLSRDLLLNSFKSKSEGTLIHPALGIIKAICTKLNIREDADQKGAYFLSVEFIKAPKNVNPLDVEPSFQMLNDALGALKSAFILAVSEFLELFSVLSEFVFFQSQIVDSIKMLNSFLVSRNGVGLFAHATYDTVKSAFDIKNETIALLRAPQNLVHSLVSAIEALSEDKKSEMRPVIFELISKRGLDDPKERATKKLLEATGLILASALVGKEQKEYLRKLRLLLSPEAYRLSYKIKLKQEQPKKKAIGKMPSLVAAYINKDLDLEKESNLFEVDIHD